MQGLYALSIKLAEHDAFPYNMTMTREENMTKEYTDVASMNLGKPSYRLTLRPTFVLAATAVFGTAVLIAGLWLWSWGLILFGLYFLGTVLFSVKTVKDRIVADLYEDSMVLYDKVDNTKGLLIRFDEIHTWQYRTGVALGDTLTITLENGDSYNVESFKARKIIAYLFKRIPDKEIHKDLFKFMKKK